MNSIFQRISDELSVQPWQVEAAVKLLDGGDTVPFVARYRKEVTGSLDDTQLRQLDERLNYLRELEDRRQVVIKSIEEQGKLTNELKQSILLADSKTRLEDLYKPYVQKRRTKAQIAKEAGLEPLADALYQDPTQDPETLAGQYLNAEHEIKDTKAALDGARQILMERFAEEADLVATLRDYLWENAQLRSKVVEGKEQAGAKFSDYFDAAEPIKNIPSHRALALFRGRKEEILTLALEIEEPEDPKLLNACEAMIANHFAVKNEGRAADKWLTDAVRWTWRVKLRTQLDMDLKKTLREAAEAEAIQVFARNLKDLLMAAPAGHKCTLGLDPGLRTGVKVIVVDDTGKLLDTATIYPHAPRNDWDQSIAILAALAQKHDVKLLSIGNGTASRETDKLAGDLIKRYPQLHLTKVMVSEAGASVYSASELAAKEFPELDVSLRGAVSIARRLQDPLAELVKIDPKSIGVGQYQHDVSQSKLARALDGVVEDCVNGVGVDLNTASAPLLARVAGLSPSLAANIVNYREQNGAFKNREELKKVPRLGDKAFEQSAGFLRITNGDNPLDASGVHPEAYPVVERIITNTGMDIRQLIANTTTLNGLSANDYVDDRFGEPTVKDIIAELDKPGRDPRPEFKTATFQEGVEKPADLKLDMVLEGVVTNVTNFGAFVDIGVHQDGLVHISQLAYEFVKDPHQVVKAGDVVKTKVMDVDLARNRISLSMRLDDKAAEAGANQNRSQPRKADGKARHAQRKPQHSQKPQETAMAAAFAQLKRG